VSNSGYPDVASAACGYASPSDERHDNGVDGSREAREAATVAIGLIEVLLVPTRLSSAWERVAAAES
jgi:hypothetical protein